MPIYKEVISVSVQADNIAEADAILALLRTELQSSIDYGINGPADGDYIQATVEDD